MLDADAACLRCYGFREPPFLESPDPRFVYPSVSLTQVIAAVLERIARGDRLIVVTGDPGIGKTTLCMELSRHLATAAAADRECGVTVIDDADLLGWGRLREYLRASTRSGEPCSQTVLVGRAQLQERLEQAGSVAWEAIDRVQLGPLDEREIGDYVERRMWVARGGIATFSESIADDVPDSGRPFVSGPHFSARAVRRLAAASNGNPRAVNVLCAQGLELAAARQAARIPAHAFGRPGVRLFVPVRPLAWCAVGLGLVAFALTPSFYSRVSSARSAHMRAASPPKPSDESFDAFRRSTLQRAAELAAVPDVNELLRVRDGIVTRESRSADPQQAVTDLLKEIDRITNDARARQLDVDRRQMLEYVKHQ